MASPKSPGIAVLLELLLPGGGAMYADRVGMGVAWLLVSLAGAVLTPVLMANVIQSATYTSAIYPYNTYVESQDVESWVVIIAFVGLGWLILRCVLATRYVHAYNERLAQVAGMPGFGVPFTGEQRIVSVGRVAAVTIGVVIASAVLAIFGYYFVAYGSSLGFVMGAVAVGIAYWYGTIRLASAPWRRVALEALAINVLLNVVFTALVYVVDIPRFGASGVIHEITSGVVSSILLALFSLAGSGLSILFAPWDRMRTGGAPADTMRNLAIVVGVAVGFRFLDLAGIITFSRSDWFLAGALVLPIVASVIAYRRLPLAEPVEARQPVTVAPGQ